MSETDSLFPEFQLLSWLPDESFFSVVSRHHQIWGHATAAQTCDLVFGSKRAGMHHDLPNCLGIFVQRTNEALGDVISIAKERTLLKFYGAFAPKVETENAAACMSGSSVAHLKLRLGILTSRFRANHPLKACPECLEHDLRETGWTYWHLTHQFPGVWICTKHRLPLLQSSLKSNGVERFRWLLPHLAEMKSVTVEQPDVSSRAALQGFAELVEHLVQLGSHQPLLLGSLYTVYRTELLMRGGLTAAGSLRTAQIAKAFLSHCKNFRHIPEFAALPEDEASMEVQLGRLLRPPRSGTHPLRHLLIIHWLFGDAQRLEQAMKSGDVAQPTLGSVDKKSVSSVVDPRIQRLQDLILGDGFSVRKAARFVGIDAQTAIVWAARDGIEISRRPKKLLNDVRNRAIVDLRKGADKKLVALSAGVSVETITRLLLSDRQLYEDWSSARDEKTRAHSRAIWLQLLHANGSLGIKWMRQLDPKAYMWLYRNDRIWLNEHKPAPLPAAQRPRSAIVNWDERDERLSALVRSVALSLMQEQGLRRIHFWQLCQLIPDLRAKQAALHRLPRTRAVIQLVLAAHQPSQDLFS